MNRSFKRADEMEMAINFKAMRLSWLFIVIALLVWLFVGLISIGEINLVLLIIILTQNLIYFSAKLLITKRMTGESDLASEK